MNNYQLNNYPSTPQRTPQFYSTQPTDENYESYTIDYFRGRIAEECIFSAGRRAILRLFTGTPDQEWVMDEIINIFPQLLPHKGGVTFISNFHAKLQYLSPKWDDTLFQYYRELLAFPAGYKIFLTLVDSIPHEILPDFTNFVFNKFELMYDPLMDQLICLLINTAKSNQELLTPLLNISLYLQDPQKFLVAEALIKLSNLPIIDQFVDSFLEQKDLLLVDENLVQVLCTIIANIPEKRVDQLILDYQPRLAEFAIHPFQWKIIRAFISCCSRSNRHKIAYIIFIPLISSNIYNNNDFKYNECLKGHSI